MLNAIPSAVGVLVTYLEQHAKKSLFLLLALLGFAFWPESADAEPLSILMVGNSYTGNGTNRHLRRFLDEDAELVGSRVSVIVPGGETLLGHYMTSRTVDGLTNTDWDVVILQDHSYTPAAASLLPDPTLDISKAGPRSFEAAYHNFWLGGRGLSDALTTANPDVKLVYFSTWARHKDDTTVLPTFNDSPEVMQEHTNASYASLSSEYPGSRVAPVGDAWQESYTQRSEFRLHDPDNSHGNNRGYYLAGAVLYELVSGRSSIDSEYTHRLSEEDARYLQGIATATVRPDLEAGDADQDSDFDQFDLVQVQIAAKYLTGQPATWGEGDWDGAPGGSQGNPPVGDGMFNQLDIVAAQQAGTYLTGPYAAVGPGGQSNDGQTSVVYDTSTGEVAVDAPADTELTSINIDSAVGIFTGDAAQNLGRSFDNDADDNIFKATFGSSFGSLTFGNVAQRGLAENFLLSDLTVIGSLDGGGNLGNVDLIYVPEPASVVLLFLAGLALVARCHRVRNV